MAYKLEVGIPGADGLITIMHTFYGHTREEASATRAAHADICPNFGPKDKAGETTELWTEIDESEWPRVTADADDGDDEEEEEEDDEDDDEG